MEISSSMPTKIVAVLMAFSLTGCASIVTGTTQPMAVETRLATGQDVAGAYCRLTNSKGTWFVTTPGTVSIHRATAAPLAINCTKEGHQQLGVSSTKPKSKGMTWGNLIFGGVIGVITDSVTGAAGYYPSPVTVIMEALAGIGAATETTGTAQGQAPAAPTTVAQPAGSTPASDWRNWANKEN